MNSVLKSIDSFAAGSLSLGVLLKRLLRVPSEAYVAHAPHLPRHAAAVACFGYEQALLARVREQAREVRPARLRLPFSCAPRWFVQDLLACAGGGYEALERLTDLWAPEASSPSLDPSCAPVFEARCRTPRRFVLVGRVQVPLLSSWWARGGLSVAGVPRPGGVTPVDLGPVKFRGVAEPVAYEAGDLLVTVYRPSAGVYASFGRGGVFPGEMLGGDVLVRVRQGTLVVEAVSALGSLHPRVHARVA